MGWGVGAGIYSPNLYIIVSKVLYCVGVWCVWCGVVHCVLLCGGGRWGAVPSVVSAEVAVAVATALGVAVVLAVAVSSTSSSSSSAGGTVVRTVH
jgi:hypothetical protein